MKTIVFAFVISSISIIAGTVTEISIFSHPTSKKQVVLFGEQHVEEESILAEQINKFQMLINQLSVKSKNGANIRFIIEQTDSINLFSKLHEEIKQKQLPDIFLDVRSIISETLSLLESSPDKVNSSLEDVLSTLKYPVAKMFTNEELSQIYKKELTEIQKEFVELDSQVDEMLQVYAHEFSCTVEQLKSLSLNQLKASDDNQDAVELVKEIVANIGEIHVSLMMKSIDNGLPDVFDLNTVSDIFQAANEAIIFHIAGVSHKAQLERMLLLLGFTQQRAYKKENADVIVKQQEQELQSIIEQRFGKNPPQALISQVMHFLIEKRNESGKKYAPQLKIDTKFFNEISDYLGLSL